MDKKLKHVLVGESVGDMKLYILKRLDEVDYDENRAVIVRASNSYQARKLASGICGTVCRYEKPETWLSAKTSSCNILKSCGKQEIILIDYRAG
jgi:hypothetical protein